MYLYGHGVNFTADLKASLFKHHDWGVVNAGSLKNNKIFISSACHSSNQIWVTILLLTLTLWEYEDGELAFISNVITQPKKKYVVKLFICYKYKHLTWCNVTVWPLGVGPWLQTSRTKYEDMPSPSTSEWPPSDHHGPDPPDAHRETELMQIPPYTSLQTQKKDKHHITIA